MPAAAIVSQYLKTATIQDTILQIVVIQATLIGLNIGAYVTKIGVLAGILYFEQIRVYNKKFKPKSVKPLKTPSRIDLVKYGLLNFITIGSILTVVLILEYTVLSVI